MGGPGTGGRQPRMVTTFDDREKAFEAQFARNEELKFRALARRDKLFALWAANRLGLTGTARDRLIHDLLAVQGFPQHDAALLRFAVAAGIDAAEAPAMLDRLGEDASEQVRSGTAAPIDLTAG